MRRELRLADAIGVGVGAMLGAGVFVVLPAVASGLGQWVFLALGLAAMAAWCNATSSAALAVRFPKAGGTYEYASEVLGPLLGFCAGWLFVVSKIAAAAAVALGLEQAVGAPGGSGVVSAGAVLAVTALNLMGVKKVGTLNLVIVAVTLIGLLTFVLYALSQPAAPSAGQLGSWTAAIPAAATLFFAFTGYARIATLAEEVAEPERTLPRAVTLSLVIVTTLYFLVAAACLKLADRADLVGLSSQTPVAGWVAAAAITALIGVLLSQELGISRVLFAMARRRDLPSNLEQLSSRGVPALAVVVTGISVLILTRVGSVLGWVSVAAFSILAYYFLTNLSLWKLEKRGVAALGLVGCSVLAVAVPPVEIAKGVSALAVGLALRALIRRFGSPFA